MASPHIQQGKIAAGKQQLTRDEIVDKPPVEIFYLYSHADEKMQEEIEKHLTLLKRQGYITTWDDCDISAGREWAQEISEHLNTAGIILLLISPDFIELGVLL